jgi:sigma-B regulation protein RsbU (phosphoserine phosphatase)
MVVEDDEAVRRIIEETLKPSYTVQTAVNGREAWSVLTEGECPGAVVLDVMMPEIDGFGLLDRIRNHDDLCGLPVLILTSRSREEDILEALDAGADDFVAKPFSTTELLTRVDRLFER